MARSTYDLLRDDSTRNGRGFIERPDTRIRVVACLAVLPLAIIFSRLASLHQTAPEVSLGKAHAVRSVVEPIPARDGRILSSDGKILAEDVETFSVCIHYRWLERPVNATWLRSEALKRLSPRERRNSDAVQHAEEEVESRRRDLWDRLEKLTGIEEEELFRRFDQVQRDVETLRQTVLEAREARFSQKATTERATGAMWWEVAFDAVRTAVTTLPDRAQEEPLILAEEIASHEIVFDQPISVAAAIEGDAERFPGTEVKVTSRRRYPYGSVAAHIVGYRFETAEDSSNEEAVSVPAGQTGIERSYDRHLQGIDGTRRVWLDRHGELVRADLIRAPRVGRDVILHLNFELQSTAERVLDTALKSVRTSATADAPIPPDAGGSISVIDVRSGAVLAAASGPRFDLSKAARRDAAFWKNISTDPSRPLFDRVAAAALPPGSVFKSVTATALLEAGVIDPDAPFDCRGYLDRQDQHRDYIYRHFRVGHGPTTLARALAESCNIYFFDGARRLGASRLIDSARLFGYGEITGIDLPGEATGALPVPSRDTDRLGMAIGQASLLATPLQVLRMTAAIANGGRLVTPHLVRGSGPSQAGEPSIRPILRARELEGLRPDTLARIREGLTRTVSHPQGTGYKSVRHPEIAIAGKTGTAEVGGGAADHAWFAGYAPADDPQYAIVVMLEHAGSGSNAAGPAARQMIDAMLKTGLIRR